MAPHLHIRFRKQRGVNLGCWFVLERWISDHPFRFAVAPAQSDLDIARGNNARIVLEEHYDSWITETDWAWIADHGFNTVRIPIGFYHLCGVDVSVLLGTDFAELAHVFSGAWSRIVKAIETAHRFGLGVLLDLHAAAGKQNPDAHSGSCNPPTFFSDAHKRQQTIHVLRTLVLQLKSFSNVVGVELLNEPQPSSDSELKKWYSDASKALAAVDPTLPIYISDCWKTEQYSEFIKSTLPTSSFLVLDHHLYRCFTSEDIKTPATAHAQALTDSHAPTPRMFARVAETLDEAGAGFIIGEWSGALHPGSLTGSADERKGYIAAQLALYEAHCSGHFFWTYKKVGQNPDRGWCLRDAFEGGEFPRVGMFLSKSFEGDHARRVSTRDRLQEATLGEIQLFRQSTNGLTPYIQGNHTSYWSRYPGDYHHARFAEGFILGWDDAYAFLMSNNLPNKAVPELGFVGAWARTRTTDHGASFWEYRHGFQQGVAAARLDFSAHYC
ncbi:glycoside hydrolase superfamily [Mycena amicta]|nr:glycoside hydrolase superfamily [Mycena amicta]